jgi:malonate decarboxylase epsilon subunit
LIAVLFPGQGSLQPGALRAAALLPRADELFAQASEILGRDVMLDDDAVAIARTDVAQRNVFLASIASLGALDLAGIRIGAVAGHSIGAYAAAVAAGVLRFGDAVRLVDLRGRTMARLFPSGYAMGVVSGLTERGIAQIIADVGGDAAYISGVNARDQITVAGRAAAIDSVLADAGLKGARIARRLDVSVPSHTPYMLEVRDTLQAALGRLQLRKPLVPYASNCDGRACLDAASVADDLSESVALGGRDGNALRTRRSHVRRSLTGRHADGAGRGGVPEYGSDLGGASRRARGSGRGARCDKPVESVAI